LTARDVLRAATTAEHARVDTLFSRFDLADRRGYGCFLSAQATALLPTEAALDQAGAEAVIRDWPARRRSTLLLSDLAELSLETPQPSARIEFASGNGPMLGAAYVLEGSRLGGAILKRGVGDGLPMEFLNARRDSFSWQKLLKLLDEFLTRADQMEAAAMAARLVFARFEEAAQRQLEAHE
jgi:heme oxygenase